MKNFIFSFIIVSISMLVACSDETINDAPNDFYAADVIYSDSNKTVLFLNDIYSNVPAGYNRMSDGSMIASATDEAVHATPNSTAGKWGTGIWSAASNWDNSFGMYSAIRKTFVFEEKILPFIQDKVMTQYGRDLCFGQVLYLRALFNFELFKRYGGYPLVKSMLQTNQDLNIPRSNYDDCVAYIEKMCDDAAALLPISYESALLGQATKGAALALKSRLLLYAASPLFNDPANPNNDFTHGKYDATKWEKAAKSADDVINLSITPGSSTSLYDLYPDYELFFSTLVANKEIIFSKMVVAGNGVEKSNGPTGYTSGAGGTCPSINLVDDYEMITGVKFDWNNAIHAANPFANREPRFAKSILYNGAIWIDNRAIETFEGGKDKLTTTSTRTGFYLRKFLSKNAKWYGTIGVANHCFPLFRFGEILLNYAESMNEAYGPDTDPQGYGMTAREAIKKIRTRAGFTGNIDLSITVPISDQNKMRTAIQHERRIELAFEEHRHFDIRRWKIADQVLNKPIRGLWMVKNGTTITYSIKDSVEPRPFENKMNFYPFPKDEMGWNKNLIQNTGW